MAQLLAEISWGDALLPPVTDAAWEAEIKRRGASVSQMDRRVAPNAWMREACLAITSNLPAFLPARLFNIGAMVTAQENACRYCYGANRAFMKVLGYSESFISRIERDVHLAELDLQERAYIAFCRNLARSRPRPAKSDRAALIGLGFAPEVVDDMALMIALCCYYNRLGILLACPPEYGFEKMANGPLGRLIGLAGPLTRHMLVRRQRRSRTELTASDALGTGPFGAVLVPFARIPSVRTMKNALDGAFASPVISLPAKALMFAIVARALGCAASEREARRLLADSFDSAEIDAALANLNSARLSATEAALLPWVRDTVHYRTEAIQAQTRALASRVGPAVLLEAVGIAGLANATVRLAMLLE